MADTNRSLPAPKREWDYCVSLEAVLGAIKKVSLPLPPSLWNSLAAKIKNVPAHPATHPDIPIRSPGWVWDRGWKDKPENRGKKDYKSHWESRCPNYYRVNWAPCFLRAAGSDVTGRATSRVPFSRGGRAPIAEEQGGAREGNWVATVRRERAGVRGSWGAKPARCPSRVRPHRPGPLEKKGTEEEGNCRADPRTEG